MAALAAVTDQISTFELDAGEAGFGQFVVRITLLRQQCGLIETVDIIAANNQIRFVGTAAERHIHLIHHGVDVVCTQSLSQLS